PAPRRGEIDRLAILLEDLPLVLWIGQRLARSGPRRAAAAANVAERLQPLARLGRDVVRCMDRRAGGDAIERATQRLARLRPLAGDVGLLAPIVLQVVELF